MNRRILQLAIPSIVSNITVPLLGLVDVTIVGHLGSAAYIGAIAVGGLLFNILYWNFGFLRMGTSGLTSQAYGRKDADAEVKVLGTSGQCRFDFCCRYSDPAISCRTAGLLFIGYQPGGRTICRHLFPGVYLGGSGCIGDVWFQGMVYRNAEFPFSHVYRYRGQYHQYCL